MNAYRGILSVLVLSAIVFVVVMIVVIAAGARSRRRSRWDRAKQRAQWEPAARPTQSSTEVVIQKVARLGNREEVLEKVLVGSISARATNHQEEVDRIWAEAQGRATQLNIGPLM